jgi:uncharacterized protein (DUF488 family)
MFYRRKILLSLIDKFGGHLKRTDLQKLLFLFCIHTKKNYYEFFPYHFGSYSFVATQDKIVLIRKGYLKDAKDFILKNKYDIGNELNSKDIDNLKSFYRQFKNIKNTALIRYTYLNYPEYTIKSKIIDKILDNIEIKSIEAFWNKDESMRLFSIGYEGLTIDGYLNKLISNNIKAVVDVRKNPTSMKYGFSKTMFKNYLLKSGIDYLHIPELGVPSNLRQNLLNSDDYRRLFRYYKSAVLPKKGKELSYIESYLNKYRRIALTCFEKEFNSCHRHVITNYFEYNQNYNFPVVHI